MLTRFPSLDCHSSKESRNSFLGLLLPMSTGSFSAYCALTFKHAVEFSSFGHHHQNPTGPQRGNSANNTRPKPPSQNPANQAQHHPPTHQKTTKNNPQKEPPPTIPIKAIFTYQPPQKNQNPPEATRPTIAPLSVRVKPEVRLPRIPEPQPDAPTKGNVKPRLSDTSY